MLKRLLCVMFVLCFAGFALAERLVWEGDTSTNFLDAANWSSGVPVAGDGVKITDEGVDPAFEPVLVNGAAVCKWFEITHGITFTVGRNGKFTCNGGGDSASVAIDGPGKIRLIDNGSVVTKSLYAAWSNDAVIEMSGNSTWLVDGGTFMLGKSLNDNNKGIARMTMSGDSLLTVTCGDFRIKGIFSGFTDYKSSLTMADNARVILGGDQLTTVLGYIENGLIVNGQVAFVGDKTFITARGEPAFVLAGADELEVTEASSSGNFTVALKHKPLPKDTITVTISPRGGNLNEIVFQGQSLDQAATLKFDSTQWDKPQSVIIEAYDDTEMEPNEILYIAVVSSSQLDDANFISTDYIPVTVFDDDTPDPGVINVLTASLNVSEDGASDKYTVVLGRAPTSTVTLKVYDLSDPNPHDADGVTSGQLKFDGSDTKEFIFTAENWNIKRTIKITAIDDVTAENKQHFTHIICGALQPTVGREYDGLQNGKSLVSIIENDRGGAVASKLRFGVINDVHHTLFDNVYSDCFIYDNSLRLNNFAAAMSKASASFVISVGDICHEAYNGKLYTADQYAQNLQSYKQNLGSFDGKKYYVLGNHEGSSALSNAEMEGIFNEPATGNCFPATYFYFDYPAYNLRFVILDAQFNEDGTSKGDSSPSYGYGYIPPAEQVWLGNVLADARVNGYKAILFCHQRIEEQLGLGLINSAEVRNVIESNNNVVPLVIQGHNHQNDHNIFNGVHYVTTYSSPFFHCKDSDPFDDWRLVEIDKDSIKITGYGNAESLTIDY